MWIAIIERVVDVYLMAVLYVFLNTYNHEVIIKKIVTDMQIAQLIKTFKKRM